MNLGGVVHLNKTGLCIAVGCVVIIFLYVFSNNDNRRSPRNAVSLKDLLKLSISAAVIGGEQIVSTRNFKIETKGKTKEGANESVTSADINSHCAMTNVLQKSSVGYRIISEENVDCRNVISQNDIKIDTSNFDSFPERFAYTRDITVWIDPLDATQEFTEKLNQYVTTMVCVAVRGKPLIGVIHKPFLKETYWAFVGHGKSSNLIYTVPEEKGKTRFIISRSHSGKIREMIKSKFSDNTIIEAGGAGYKVLELVKGNADVYIHHTAIKKWDICAGNAILNAVGGKMTTLSGDSITYDDESEVENADGLVAAVKEHDSFINLL